MKLRGCIQLGFQRILNDFLLVKKSWGIQSRFLNNRNK